MLETFRSTIRNAGRRARHRRQYRAVLALDEHLLRDMGYERAQIEALMRL